MQERRPVAALSRPLRLAIALVVAAAVVVADQVTKSLALHDLRHPVHLVGPLGLALQFNTGSAFSLFTGDGTMLAVVAAILAAGVVWLAWRSSSVPMAVAAGLVLGGAVGNLADRVGRGRVVDFITLSHWPTFNVADSCITVGVVLVAALYLFAPGRQPGRAPTPASGDEPGDRPGDRAAPGATAGSGRAGSPRPAGPADTR